MTNMILAETAPAEIAAENAVPAAGGSVTVAVIAAVAVVVIIVLIAVAVFLWRRKKGVFPFDELESLPCVAVPTLTFETVLRFFKEKSRLKALRGNADLLAVAVKKEAKDGKTKVVLCLFDKKKGELFEPETHAVLYYVADALGNDLAEQFGDKDMTVLQ